jgi:diguanylate cyclase (GGDEF)-like protein
MRVQNIRGVGMTAELRSKILSSDSTPSDPRHRGTGGFSHRKIQWALGTAAILSAATVTGLFLPVFVPGLVTQGLALSALVTTSVTFALAHSLRRRQIAAAVQETKNQSNDRHSAELVRAYESNECGWFWRTDANGYLIYISPTVAQQLGCEVSQLIGTQLKELVLNDDVADFGEAQADHAVEFTLRAGLQFRDLVVKSAKDADNHWALSGTPLKDHKGRLTGFLGSGLNLTEQRRKETEAARLALYDALTGLPNRVLIRQTLDDLLRGKTGRAGDCGLFLMDLDRFKNVNDTLGHPVGDELLKLVAKRLARVIGNQGQFGRLGGDEFQVVIPQVTDRAKLAELADAIITRLSLPYMINECTVQIGATIGIAISPLDGVDADELTRNADLALYAAKAAGKGVHRFFQPQMHQQANHRRALEDDLREVLEKGELHLAYQPIVDARSEQTVGYEALLRWNHPVRGSVSPSEFVPIAEESGLINRIGDWVIRTACEEAAKWPQHLRLSVNLSPVQFKSASLAPTIMHALADSGLDPQRLELEVTEGVLLHEDALVERVVNQVTSMNVRLVLDDFGVGYASLGYLRRLPFSKIKIDQSFVRGAVDQRARNKEIICAIVGLANSLGMETVAEGVETLDEIELIRVLGCTQIQGFVFGRPTNAEDTRARAMKLVPPTPAYDPELADGEPKIAVLRVARLRTDGKSFAVKIRAVSASGATIEAPGDAAIGVAVELALTDGWQLAGEVAWRKGGRFGVTFDQPIDLDAFMRGDRGRDEEDDEELAQTARIARAA